MGVQQAFTVDRSGNPAAQSLQSTVKSGDGKNGVGFPIVDPGVFPNGTAKSVASYYQGQPAVDPIPAVRPSRLRSSARASSGRGRGERCRAPVCTG